MYKLKNFGDNRNSSQSRKAERNCFYESEPKENAAEPRLIHCTGASRRRRHLRHHHRRGLQQTRKAGSSNPEQTTNNTKPEESTKDPDDKPIVADKVSFISPLTNGNISKEWSADIPVFSDTMEDYRVHLGVDLEADAGTPVYAAADGTIESVEFDPMMGQTIVISHANGYKSVYRNLQTTALEYLYI